jgi:hypothetical protein
MAKYFCPFCFCFYSLSFYKFAQDLTAFVVKSFKCHGFCDENISGDESSLNRLNVPLG